jgi:zinc protease
MACASRHGWRIAAGIALLSTAVSAQPPSQPLTLQDRIPFDAAVRTGTLPNGLKFFIRQNARPEKRLSLRLAVKAGSLFEEDDQQGLAHFLEHMAFNGSAHFKPGELVSYFESTGARLGPHVNAYTSFDETVYMLELPTDSKEIVSKGFTALADFAGGLTIDPGEVDKERGVVVEEWRGRLGAGSRIRDQQIPVLYHQSRYATRLPIGKPEILRNAPAARLRAFYDTWYRPDRMALIAVGDANPQELEATIRETFGPLQPRGPAARPPDNRVPLHTETLVSVVADAELTSSSVQLLRKRSKDSEGLVSDYRRTLVENLFTHMLNDRFDELARKPDAKFLTAGGGGDSIGPTADAFELSARVVDGGLTAGLAALQIEARRVVEHGFTAGELDRAKRWTMAFFERAYNERDKTESGSFAQEYLNYFLVEEPSPGIDYEVRLVRQFLPGITLADVAALARSLLSGEGSVVLATLPQKETVRVPAPVDLQAALADANRTAVTPWSDTTTAQALMPALPEPGRVASRRELPDIGVTVVTFANGVEAWLKSTDFKNDQVLFTMYSLGGASAAATPEDHVQARFASQYVGLSGVGGIKALDLDKLLAGKIASASPFISSLTHGISGSAAPAELETALQLLHMYATAPGDDPDALALMKRQIEASVANRGRSPGQLFGEKVAEVNTSGHFSSKPLTEEQIRAMDRARMLAFYRQRFSNAADFSFFMVGTFTVDRVIPLLAQYVGSLPSAGRKTASLGESGLRFPGGVQRARVEKGREPRSQTLISFYADPSYDPVEQERVIAATFVLQTVLRDSLREDLGQTYTVSVGLDQSPPRRGYGSIGVSFGAAPENIDAMSERVIAAVRALQTDGPSADLVSNAKEGARRDYETALKQNGYWMRRLQTVHLIGGNPSDIPTRVARIEALTPAAVQEAFKKYFPLDRYTVVTLVPESPPAKP